MAAILSVNTRIAPLELWANVGKSKKFWQPTPYTWICSTHFVGGVKSDEPTSPAYTPSFFAHIKGPRVRVYWHGKIIPKRDDYVFHCF